MVKSFQIKHLVFSITFLLGINGAYQDLNIPVEQNSFQSIKNVDGEYKSENPDCFISIKISGLGYTLQNGDYQVKDTLEINSNDKSVLLRFKNVHKDYVKKDLTAELIDDYIVIQNYGNSLNNYIVFNECEEKYIELKRK